MTARLLTFWARINASYWFWPATFSLSAFFLALLTLHFDRSGMADVLSSNAAIIPARPDGASTMLQVIAGSMIGVAATVFSITIAAVAYASGTYGPRLLTNFMEDRGNQLSLATFIGTFVYAIMVLRAVRAENEQPSTIVDTLASDMPGFVPQLSLLVATGFMLVSIATLVFFLNHIPSSIRINVVLRRIGERLIRQVQDRFPQEGSDGETRNEFSGDPVPANGSGYIEVIDFAGLQNIASDCDTSIALNRRAGEFVHPRMVLAHFQGSSPDDDVVGKVQSCFILSGLRTPQQDLPFLIDELVEITLRALSPGINDPFTAITAIHWLGAATAELGRRELCVSPNDKDKQDKRRIYPLHLDFGEYLQLGFGSARSAIASCPKAAIETFKAMADCGQSIESRPRIAAILAEGDRLFEQAQLHIKGPDLADVTAAHDRFRTAIAGQ